MESRSGGLEDGETSDGAGEADAVLAADTASDLAGLTSVLDEAVGVRLAVDVHSDPFVGGNVDVGDVDVAVLLDEVVTQDRGKQLGGVDGVLLGHDEGGVLNGIGGDNDAVVGLGVGGVNVALQQAADGHLRDMLDTGLLVAVNLEDADIVLSVAGGGNVRHVGLGSDRERNLLAHCNVTKNVEETKEGGRGN